MMDREDLDVSRVTELIADPRVVLPADVAFVQIGFRGVGAHHREPGGQQALGAIAIERLPVRGEAVTEQPLEMDVADVARIVVAGDHDLRRLDLGQPRRRLFELPLVAGGREIARDDGHVRTERVHRVDRGSHRVLLESDLAAVDVRHLRDAKRKRGDGHIRRIVVPEVTHVADRISHSLVKALRSVPDFSSLDDHALLRIVGASANLFWPAGALIFEKDSPSEALFVVLSGRVQIFERAGDREVEVARVEPGSSFGELSLLLNTTHTKDARALEDSELMVVPKASFQEVLDSNPDLAAQLQRRLAERLPVSGEVATQS